MLAHRSDANDSVARVLALTTEPEVVPHTSDDRSGGEKPQERALIL